MLSTHTTNITIVFSILALVSPLSAGAQATPIERDFVITAYYSPLPGQCCYVTGSEESDKELNGHGTHGADGTPVYPGMVAAPKSYAFGTRISLPGIGIVTVHDRGGAIVEQDKTDRLDIWMGSGEEGLARALAFGVQRVHGTIYPPESEQPKEAMDIARFTAPLERIAPYAQASITDVEPKAGDHSLSVRLLQGAMKDAGIFDHPVTGFFGDVTKTSLQSFIAMYGLAVPSDRLTTELSAYLLAAKQANARIINLSQIDKTSSSKDIKQAQRFLRSLGYYDGRTDGIYSETLFNAIFALQQEKGLVGSTDSPGAGRIGPKTLATLQAQWRQRLVSKYAQRILLAHEAKEKLEQKGKLPTRTLAKGQSGNDVAALQRFLSDKGFFQAADINGHFGEKTEAAVSAYQRDRGLITTWSKKGEGTVGPLTLEKIQNETVASAVSRVSAYGWNAL